MCYSPQVKNVTVTITLDWYSHTAKATCRQGAKHFLERR